METVTDSNEWREFLNPASEENPSHHYSKIVKVSDERQALIFGNKDLQTGSLAGEDDTIK